MISSACDLRLLAFSTSSAASSGFPVARAKRKSANAWRDKYPLPTIVSPKRIARANVRKCNRFHEKPKSERAGFRANKEKIARNRRTCSNQAVSNFSMINVSARAALVHSANASSAIIVSM